MRKPGNKRTNLRPQLLIAAVVALLSLWGLAPKYAPLVGVAAPAHSATMTKHLRAMPMVQGATTVATPDCAHAACLALTFDDGPQPQITPQVLAILARHHVHATFFLIGIHVPGNEELVRRMYSEGHEIGNHTWSHLDLTALPPSQIEGQILQAQAVIANTGVPAPRLFRPPYGAVNASVRSHTPLTIALWDADPEDWKKTKAADIVSSVEASAGPGKVIDMHDIRQPTADALDQILTDLVPKYQFVTVSQLLDFAPGQQGVFFGR